MSLAAGIGVLVTGTDSPVSIDSFKMQLPVSKTASHGNMQPYDGITSISPGTRYLADTVAVDPVERSRRTVATSEEETVERRFRWFCK
jgi:hypothetical protein